MTTDPNNHLDHGQRLTRLEVNFSNLDAKVDHISQGMDRIEVAVRGSGKVNWPFVSVLVAIVGVVVIPTLSAIFVIGMFAFNVVQGQIHANQSRLVEMDQRMTRNIEAEQARNNRIEREMGEAAAVDKLFQAGRLKLE